MCNVKVFLKNVECTTSSIDRNHEIFHNALHALCTTGIYHKINADADGAR